MVTLFLSCFFVCQLRKFAKVGDKVKIWSENETSKKNGVIIEIIENDEQKLKENNNNDNNISNTIDFKPQSPMTKKTDISNSNKRMKKKWHKKNELYKINNDCIVIECENKIYKMLRNNYEWHPIIKDELSTNVKYQCNLCYVYTTRIDDHLENICPKNKIKCVLCNDNNIERQNLVYHWKYQCKNYKIKLSSILSNNQHNHACLIS